MRAKSSISRGRSKQSPEDRERILKLWIAKLKAIFEGCYKKCGNDNIYQWGLYRRQWVNGRGEWEFVARLHKYPRTRYTHAKREYTVICWPCRFPDKVDKYKQ